MSRLEIVIATIVLAPTSAIIWLWKWSRRGVFTMRFCGLCRSCHTVFRCTEAEARAEDKRPDICAACALAINNWIGHKVSVGLLEDAKQVAEVAAIHAERERRELLLTRLTQPPRQDTERHTGGGSERAGLGPIKTR